MASSEVTGLAGTVTGAVWDGVRCIEGAHRAIAERSWGLLGAAGAPSRAVHDLVAGVAVGAGLAAAGAVAAQSLDMLAQSRHWPEGRCPA
jgi:hypothetical protein